MKLKSYIFGIAAAAAGAAFLGSCEDMLEPTSDYVLYDDGSHLTTPADTANSLIGIIYKLQAIGDRTNLLGEMRGDLVQYTSFADADLRELAEFTVDDDNIYNSPRDYYAVINNCNYYIAYADSTAFDNRGNRIFNKEIAQVKAIRAWTYLQLALIYGKVPFYTEPLLTEQDADAVGLDVASRKDLSYICDYFIDDLVNYTEVDWPNLHTVGSILMANCFFPVKMVLGDLYLWRATLTGSQADYREAAYYYFNWIQDTRTVGDATKSYYIVSPSYRAVWNRSTASISGISQFSLYNALSGLYSMSTGSYNNETFTIIPMDSASSQGYYSQVRGLYNSTTTDNTIDTSTGVSITPSERMQEISRSQSYYYLELQNNEETNYPVALDDDQADYEGDLRLGCVWTTRSINTTTNGVLGSYTYQNISKLDQLNITVYRQSDTWLRLAEALNNGGFPRFAYAILATGLGEVIMTDSILPYCDATDSSFINNRINTANNYFANYIPRDGAIGDNTDSRYSIGIHARGSGYSERNPDYAYPMVDSVDASGNYINGYQAGMSLSEWAQLNLETEKAVVDSMILNEMALETCFEGKRFYDLMRHAKRYNKPSILADAVARREGEDNYNSTLYSTLMLEKNWYLSWNNQIGWE